MSAPKNEDALEKGRNIGKLLAPKTAANRRENLLKMASGFFRLASRGKSRRFCCLCCSEFLRVRWFGRCEGVLKVSHQKKTPV